ncbi:MAG TPA: HDOD domain-containing protein, partial [Pseudomonadales bacterium]|nr:HDOD domain-containing protein [Pseudomonadales bacterium]
MAVAVSIKRFLQKMGVAFREHPHHRSHCLFEIAKEQGISPQQIAVAELYQGKSAKYMVVHSLAMQVDPTCLNHLSGETLKPFEGSLPNLFADAEPGCIPPLPEPYGISGIVDLRLFSESRVYFYAGSHAMLVSVSGNDFAFLLSSASRGVISRASAQTSATVSQGIIPEDVHLKLLYSYTAPELPVIAGCVLERVMNKAVCLEELAALVKTDMTMTNRICAGGGTVEAVLQNWGEQRAAANIFGLSLEQCFCVQQQGFLGSHVFWRRAYLSAALVDFLGQRLALENHALAIISAIVHDIGILLVGHWFPPELNMMSRLLETQPGLCLSTIEQRVMGLGQAQQFIGLGHAKLGAWLTMQWQLPDPVVAAVAYHHVRGYSGAHSDYVNLIQLVDQLLTANGKNIDDIGSAAMYFGALAGVPPERIQTVLQDRCL